MRILKSVLANSNSFRKINPTEYERKTKNGTYLIRNDNAIDSDIKTWSLWLDGEYLDEAKTKSKLVKLSLEHWQD